MAKNFIKCDDLVKIYSNGPVSVTALRGINYLFESGVIYVIFGPSGSGKTTLLSILGGFLTPTAGCVNFNDSIKIDNKSEDLFDFRIQNISFIFQRPFFIPFLNSEENIDFFSKEKKKNISENIDSIFELTNLTHRKKLFPYQLSGGERQRLSIAIALFLNNKIWLCDEPTGTLDSENKVQIMNLLKKIIQNDPSKVLIIVTHDPIFQKIADKILILKDGFFDLELSREEFDHFSSENALYKTLDQELADSIQKQNILKKIEEIKRELTKEDHKH